MQNKFSIIALGLVGTLCDQNPLCLNSFDFDPL
jgi:hypothetical protein